MLKETLLVSVPSRPLLAGNPFASTAITDQQIDEILVDYVLTKGAGRTDMCVVLANALNIPVESVKARLDHISKSRSDSIAQHARNVAASLGQVLASSTSPAIKLRGQKGVNPYPQALETLASEITSGKLDNASVAEQYQEILVNALRLSDAEKHRFKEKYMGIIGKPVEIKGEVAKKSASSGLSAEDNKLIDKLVTNGYSNKSYIDSALKQRADMLAESSKDSVEYQTALSLTPLEYVLVYSYCNYSYEKMNPFMRSMSSGDDEALGAMSEDALSSGLECIEVLNGSFAKLENLNKNKTTILYRGLRPSAIKEFRVGKTYTADSFISTSKEQYVAEEFMQKSGALKGAVLLRIKAKSGADLSGINTIGEAEILQKAGTQYKVVNKTYDENFKYHIAGKGAYIIDLEEI